MGNREVRVFVSSTFQDMRQEREELAKHVFPQLREVCEKRRVSWTDVDLRWGVTDEQKARGLALSICLAEIQECRPFFIGILGERYGWVPATLEPHLLEEQPWLADHGGHSITHLEILHGVLNNPEMAEHAFFYFHDPDYRRRLPREETAAAYCSEDARSAKMLADLKGAIRASGFPVRENYRGPKEFGQCVLEDMLRVIDRRFPSESIPDELDRQAAEHEAFAESRRRVYIPRREYFDRLDAHADGTGPPLVVAGGPGCGKSALLANWVAHRRASRPPERMMTHFVGAAQDSAYWPEILRRISGELWRQFDKRLEIPSGVLADAEYAAFMYRLEKFSAKGRFIVVLDGLDHLDDRERGTIVVDGVDHVEDRERGLALSWLSPSVPVTYRLIVSTSSGRQLKKLRDRGWPILTLQPLTVEESSRMVADYLASYGKTLSPVRTRRIVEARPAHSALGLRTVLEELRLFGSHEQLDERIADYLSASGPEQLFDKVLARFEQDFEKERPGLVRDAFSPMWVSRAGLSEAELADLLGGAEPLGGAIWSPLRLAAGTMLTNRSGLLGFGDSQLRDAVKKRYLPRAEDEDAARLRLADYFESRENGPRKTVELPWQLFCLGAWDRLTALLAEPSFLTAAWEEDPRAVRRYWKQVEALTSTNRGEVYASCAEDWPTTHPRAARMVVELLSEWKEQPPELEATLAETIATLNEALQRNQLPPADEAFDDADDALDPEEEANCAEPAADVSDDGVERQNAPAVEEPELVAVEWTPVEPYEQPFEELVLTPAEIGSMREYVCDMENAGKLNEALAHCQFLTKALREADNVKQLRTHLIIEARLLKRLEREDEARRLAREIIHLTLEHDPKTFDLFQELIKGLGLTGS